MHRILLEKHARLVMPLLAAVALAAVAGCGPADAEPFASPTDTRTRKDAATESGGGGGGDSGVVPGSDGATPDPDTAVSDPDSAAYDTDPAPAPDPDGGGSDPCSTCVETNCGAELTACEADATCKKQLDCIDACADNACAEKCWKDFPSSKADDVFNCVDSKCAKECF